VQLLMVEGVQNIAVLTNNEPNVPLDPSFPVLSLLFVHTHSIGKQMPLFP
jgi:hypothetical protein